MLLRLLLSLILLMFSREACAQSFTNTSDPTPRHAQEIRALTDPSGAMQAIPALLTQANQAENHAEVALLHLARANACRIFANWPCQRESGLAVIAAAQRANRPILQVRGQIALARAETLLQNFTKAESALADAGLLLKSNPFPLLDAEVQLAYSSISQGIGKTEMTIQYAERGLAALHGAPGSQATQTRLLRNRASAYANQKLYPLARQDLQAAQALLVEINDPKLKAEISLETARIAFAQGDLPTQIANAEIILTLAAQLENSQLKGLGHEVKGLAAQSNNDPRTAIVELRKAVAAFSALKLRRDELRALHVLLNNLAKDPERSSTEVSTLATRFLNLQTELDVIERAHAADSFEAGLKYAQQQLQVQALRDQEQAANVQSKYLEHQRRLMLAILVSACTLLALLGLVLLWQRKTQRRLQHALNSASQNEARFRALSETAQDIVVRMAPDGTREYVSASVTTLLGYEPSELIGGNWDMVHQDDLAQLRAAMDQALNSAQPLSLSFRVLHKHGDYLWLETIIRRVPSVTHAGQFEVVFAARDVTARKRAELALAASEKRLQSVADNVPALISYIDTELKYQFVNAHVREIFGTDPKLAIGRTVLEMRGTEAYREIEPYVRLALQGEASSFEGSLIANGKSYHYQAKFVPDINENGQVIGFYSVTFDITERKLAELELERLARFDSLTGLANRRHFDERMQLALTRCRRTNGSLSLISIDIDHFKAINDTLGHPFGDSVIREFANRLQSSARESDLVARTGGDEFMVLVEDVATNAEAEQIAQRLLQQLKPPMLINGTTRTVTASIGVAFVPQTGNAEQLITAADKALYAAKHAGRNTYDCVVI